MICSRRFLAVAVAIAVAMAVAVAVAVFNRCGTRNGAFDTGTEAETSHLIGNKKL